MAAAIRRVWRTIRPRARVRGGEAGRDGIGVAVKSGVRVGVVARPETRAADLVAIGYTNDCIGQVRRAAGVEESWATREARDREIEAAPEEMHQTGLAQEAGAESREQRVRDNEGAPEAVRGIGVVGAVNFIGRKRDRVVHLVWSRADGDMHPEHGQRIEQFAVERRDRFGRECDARFTAAAGEDGELVRDEIEADLDQLGTPGDRRRA